MARAAVRVGEPPLDALEPSGCRGRRGGPRRGRAPACAARRSGGAPARGREPWRSDCGRRRSGTSSLSEVGLERGVVAPRPGEQHVRAGLAAEGRGEGVLEALERAEQALQRVPAAPGGPLRPGRARSRQGQADGVAPLVDDRRAGGSSRAPTGSALDRPTASSLRSNGRHRLSPASATRARSRHPAPGPPPAQAVDRRSGSAQAPGPRHRPPPSRPPTAPACAAQARCPRFS